MAVINNTDPFATPEQARSPVRRLRGRLPAPVTLWAAIAPGGTAAGLTVSSTLVVDGEPGRLLGLLDEESELWPTVQASGRFVVAVLGPDDRQLADRFAGLLPAPGGPFRGYDWVHTPYGPVPARNARLEGHARPEPDARPEGDAGLAGSAAWVGCRLDAARPLGWSLLVEATIEHVELGRSSTPLVHYRGRYRALA